MSYLSISISARLAAMSALSCSGVLGSNMGGGGGGSGRSFGETRCDPGVKSGSLPSPLPRVLPSPLAGLTGAAPGAAAEGAVGVAAEDETGGGAVRSVASDGMEFGAVSAGLGVAGTKVSSFSSRCPCHGNRNDRNDHQRCLHYEFE